VTIQPSLHPWIVRLPTGVVLRLKQMNA